MSAAVVAIGGGHGQAATLRAVRRYTDDITAIVAVSDDGGSSGRLREALAIPPPGDLRRCLLALADGDPVWRDAFGHRFEDGDVAGHVLGNLVIAGLAAEAGDFLEGLDAAARSLGVHGRVLPATTEEVVLEAVTDSGPVRGQVALEHTTGIQRVALTPADAPAPKEAIEAIAAADQIVLCPGSLFTSLLAAAVVPDITLALSAATARRVYVCNLRNTPETAGFDVAAHLRALADHGLDVDVVLCHPEGLPIGDVSVPVVLHPVATPSGLAHSPALLAEALAGLL